MGTPKENDTFESKVNAVVSDVKKSDDGKWELPEDLDEAVAYAATAELRRRDTQSAYTKSQQEAAALRKENETLAASYEQDVTAHISTEDKDRLEELKHSDPDKWRTELDKLNTTNKSKFAEKRKQIKETAHKETELERRTRLLEEHNAANPEHALTDEVLENDIPPRFTKRLEKGEITFDEFLDECNSFLGKPRAIQKGEKAPDEPNLSTSGGTNTPSAEAIEGDIKESYKNEIY